MLTCRLSLRRYRPPSKWPPIGSPRKCWLRLTVDAQASTLYLAVQDDGRGIAPERRLGVGLRSMRERATELGGTLTVEPGDLGGTLVRARLPLRS